LGFPIDVTYLFTQRGFHMKIDQYLKGVQTAQPAAATEKVASAASTATTPATQPGRDVLLTALNNAVETAKTASEQAPNPVNDVVKIASEVAEAEKAANVKEAQLMGIAFADAAIARINDWQKTAAANMPADASDLQKQAAEAGYRQAIADMEKQAEEEYARGYNETVETIHKIASLQFIHGAQSARKLIQTAAR
jgi:hypothetical protein